MQKEMKEQVKEKYIKWFSEIHKTDVDAVGGKGANLGEMFNLKMPVPPGFVITASAYRYFLQSTGLDKGIYPVLNKLEIENTKEVEEESAKIRELIEKAKMPRDLQEEIEEAYENLSVDKESLEKASSDALSILKKVFEPAFVAVRSSATAEDSGEASFAGQQETFINVKGNFSVIESVKKCFASLFTARSIYYRVKKGFKHERVSLAAVIQIMINSDKSGVIFSKDPITQNENVIVDAVFGLGEGIVSGAIQPDHYLVSRELKILSKSLVKKKIAFVRNSAGETEKIKLTDERSKSQVLSDSEIKRLASYAIDLEEHYKTPQDIEFAIDSGNIYIVQTRPITTLEKKDKKFEVSGEAILTGISASPGVGSGIAKVVRTLEDLQKIKNGDILVTKMTNPDMVLAMQKSAGIVTDEGGMTAHAAIVSREMGIPCVVGTDRATELLKDGMKVTVNGSNGKVYLGLQEGHKAEINKIVKTETKIKVIVDLPDFAARAAETGAKQVGLTRLEGIIAESGKHPLYFITQGNVKDYEEIIFQGVNKIAEYFDEVWVRTSDIRSDEYRNLQGSNKEVEVNPMLGMHGVRFSLKHKELMLAELRALKRVADKGKIIGVMIPQLIEISEVVALKQAVKEIHFDKAKVGVMIETPAAVQIIEEICNQNIEFISFGTNDLTQFTLAIDRGNEHVQYLYNEMNPSILRQLATVIKICKERGVETSICGQAGSNRDMVEFLVLHGIDSVSCNADKAGEISVLVRELEQKDLKGSQLNDVMARKAKITQIDDLRHVEKHEEKVKHQIQEQKAEEQVEEEENTEIEKSNDFPDVHIGFDPFADQSNEKEDRHKKKHKEESKEDEVKPEQDEELDVF